MSDQPNKHQHGDEGHRPPYSGKEPQGSAEYTSDGSRVPSDAVTSAAGGVILRASVATFGPAGDAELQFTVKWPAAALAAGQNNARRTQKGNSNDEEDEIDTDGNLHTRASVPSGPSQ